MANTTGDIRTVDEILGDEVQLALKVGRSYIILSLSCVETLTKQWKDKLQEVWELQELNEHLEDKIKKQQQKTGHWIEHEGFNEGRYYDCSVCDCSLREIHRGMGFCPYCGAKMDNPL